MRKLDTSAGEGVKDQTRTVETDRARARIDSATGTGGVPAAPGVGHADLGLRPFDDILNGLVSIDQGHAAAVGDAGVGGLENAQLLQELLPELLGGLIGVLRDLQNRVDDLDGVAGQEGRRHHRQRQIPFRGLAVGRHFAARGRSRSGRGRIPAVPGSRAGCGQRDRCADGGLFQSRGRHAGRGRPRPRGIEFFLSGFALCGQSVDLGLLRTESRLRFLQSRDRGVLAALGVADRTISFLFGRTRGCVLVDHLGAGAPKAVHHPLRAQRQRLTGGRGGDDLVGCPGHHQGGRRAVDVARHREGVEPLLGLGDGRGGVLDRLLARFDLLLSGSCGVPRVLHRHNRLVDALLLGLNRGPDVLETLIGLGDVGHQSGQTGGCRAGISLSQARDRQGHGNGEGQRADGPGSPNTRTARGWSHSTLTPKLLR